MQSLKSVAFGMESKAAERAYLDTPIGVLELLGGPNGIRVIRFVDHQEDDDFQSLCLREGTDQLKAYFSGERKDFDLQLDMQGTEFQKKVWQELLTISHGKTTSYLQLSRDLGDEKAIRAVGTANGRNPLSIVVPCHRVVGSDGSLTGYAGGLHRKKWLLEFEQNAIQGELF